MSIKDGILHAGAGICYDIYMEKISELKNPYIRVGSSYGGSQNFFREKKGFLNKYKAAGGCGIIAMSDTMNYLCRKTTFADREDYTRICDMVIRHTFWIPNKFGMTFYRIILLYPHILKRAGLSCRCFWGLSRRKLLPRIEEMIKNDTPVILNVPKLLFPLKNRKEKLTFYDENEKPAAFTAAHFVVVTGIYRSGEETYLQISSWGKKYYISLKEFTAFTKKTLLGGILGNILYFTSIENTLPVS